MFTLPLHGGAGVEACFASVFSWVLARLPRQFRSVCKLPSSLVVRLLWEKFVKQHMGEAGSSGGDGGGGVEQSRIESSTASAQTKSRFHPGKASKSWQEKQNSVRQQSSSHASAGADDTAHVALFLSASMETEFELFAAVLRQCLEMQILMEFLAYTLGFLDGWE